MRRNKYQWAVLFLVVFLTLLWIFYKNTREKEEANSAIAGVTYVQMRTLTNNYDITAGVTSYIASVVKESKDECLENVEIKESLESESTVVVSTSPRNYTDDDLYLLSHVINGEAGANWCTDTMRLYSGSVVLNRIKDSRFPDTIEEVIYQPGQYKCTWDGNFNKPVTEGSMNAAIYLLENGSQLPENVVFQSEFPQGQGIYTKEMNLYFCY